jgi:localization factor PodJL
LRQAAAKGDPRAQHEIGLRYTNGIGIKRNLSEAAVWYERAASKEFAPAQYRLGSLYEKGLGVKRDLVSATNWYLRAAEQGNARAMHNLAVINAMGSNGKPDMDEALKWFTKAANYGVKDSQFNLGILYGQGMGVKQDLSESYKWFALAAKTGDRDSAKKRDEVANVMDPKALEKSRLVVRAWQPEKLVDAANRVVIPEEWRGKSSSAKVSAGGQSAVRTTQVLLNKLGYKVGTPDGMTGPKTRRAIMSFQKTTGMKPTGKVDAALIKALKGLSI